MPELAEVEYYRRQWNPGLGRKIVAVQSHPDKRIFRSAPQNALLQLAGATFLCSEARGKWMLFQFSGDFWLHIHLGMTGKLRVESPAFTTGRHDHLILRQRAHSLVFSDPRLFGQVRFHHGPTPAPFWLELPPSPDSPEFTLHRLRQFLGQHPRLPIKGTLLLQAGFPGIGNWMADEALWRAKLHPATSTRVAAQRAAPALWQALRWVSRQAIETIGASLEPPPTWLFHQRWNNHGLCPLHKIPLHRQTIAGRTTAWCPRCQPSRRSI